jgi:hypothetical protein
MIITKPRQKRGFLFLPFSLGAKDVYFAVMHLIPGLLNEPARYFPFQSGRYSTAPGLSKLGTDFGNGAADQRIFQMDHNYPVYRENKLACREENIHKYYCRKHENRQSLDIICRFIINQLVASYPNVFSRQRGEKHNTLVNQLTHEQLAYDEQGNLLSAGMYADLFDALSAQLQEDLAIWQSDAEEDWMSTIHLSAPNHWSPADKIARPFSEVHAPVAGMEKMRARYRPMMNSLLKGGSFVRFAWGLSTDQRLNHHPLPPPGVEKSQWEGRAFNPAAPALFVRVERQTLTGFPESGAVLFTIRTYFEDVQQLSGEQKKSLRQALLSMPPESLQYKGLEDDLEAILGFLE